jgi:2',3'-cyclic-nucleotide 2'-phosphodiesterase (5'-nucleotidase family)
VLLVDGGDAMSPVLPSLLDPADREGTVKRAAFLLHVMGLQGYQAMAVGERDLVFAPAELKKLADQEKIALLAANLTDASGAPLFASRTVLTAGGRKVGLFAVCDGAEYTKAGLVVKPPAEAAQAQVEALRREGAELIVGLLHMGYSQSLKVAASLKGVDFLIQADEGRSTSTQAAGGAILAAGGDRGRELGRVDFAMEGKGPLFDLSDAEQAHEQLVDLEKQMVVAKARPQKSPEDGKRQELLIAAFEKRRAELKARAEARPPPGRRTVAASFVELDASVPDDRPTSDAVAAIKAVAPERRSR